MSRATERLLGEQAGYSMVEVLAAIVILSAAILPMVGMFDAGLRAAQTGGDYDEARLLANRTLEQAKSLPYETVRDGFPNGTATPAVSLPQPPPAEFPGLSSYAVEKSYVEPPPAEPASPTLEFEEGGSEDTGLVRLTVAVTWDEDETYTATGLVAR